MMENKILDNNLRFSLGGKRKARDRNKKETLASTQHREDETMSMRKKEKRN